MRFSLKISLVADLLKYRLKYARGNTGASARISREKILLVRLDRIGDFALYAPFAAALRERFPAERYEITLLGRSLWMPLAKEMLPFDHWLELEPGTFMQDVSYRHSILQELSASRFNRLLQPRFYRELSVEDLIALAVAAPVSAAFSTSKIHLQSKVLCRFDSIYTDKVDSSSLETEHELNRNRAFLKQLGMGTTEIINNPWQQKPGIVSSAPAISKPYAVILPGSGKVKKCIWPPERFARLAALAFSSGLQVALTGTPDETELAREIVTHAGVPVHDFTGRQTIGEFAGLLQNARLVIGNDTGGIHIAAMSGIPSLVITGQGQPGTFLPYPEQLEVSGAHPPRVLTAARMSCAGCGWQCTRPTAEQFLCLKNISVETACRSMQELLTVL